MLHVKPIQNNHMPAILAILITALCYCVFCVTGLIYAYTDNITVAVVADGMYGNNNYCQYLHPVFCLLIKWLNPLLPKADVFTTLVHLALLYATALLSYLVMQAQFQKPVKSWTVEDYISGVLSIFIIVYPTLGMNLFGVNYTVQTAAIIFAGILILFYKKDQEKSGFWIISGTALTCFGFMIRQESALLFIPFICLEFFVELFRTGDKKARIRRDFKTLFPCLVLILVLLGSKAVFYSREPYATDARYNRYRTIAEDYWMKGYNRYDPAFEGLDQSTYSVVRDWILFDTDRLNADTVEKVAKAGSDSAYVKSLDSVRYVIRAMNQRITHEDIHLLIMTALIIILTLWIVCFVKNIWIKIEAALSFFGGFLILFYFTFIGRAPMRVWQCVLLAQLMVLILVIIKNAAERKNKRPQSSIVFQLLLCIILYFGTGQVMAVSEFHPFQTPLTAKTGADDRVYARTFEGDALYLWPIWHSTIPDYFSKENKLPTQRVLEHNIAVGDWLYGQEYFREFLTRIDAENPATALLERPNTYLMEGQNEEILHYMQEHYGEDIRLKYAGVVNKKIAYLIIRVEDSGYQEKGLPEKALR